MRNQRAVLFFLLSSPSHNQNLASVELQSERIPRNDSTELAEVLVQGMFNCEQHFLKACFAKSKTQYMCYSKSQKYILIQ